MKSPTKAGGSATTSFDPVNDRLRCEAYLGRALGSSVRLVHAEMLEKSTRAAPWRLDVQVDGAPRSYVLRLEPRRGEHEVEVLQALESIPTSPGLVPAPRAYGWDPTGQGLGVPCFFCDFVAGESLLKPLVAGDGWAEDLYLDTVCALQAVTWEQLSAVAHRFGEGESAADVLEAAYAYFKTDPHPLADAVYSKLQETRPSLPAVRFSNGDLWPDNLIVRDCALAGVVDWENAGFSDPIFEFLLAFFVAPELRGRGIEERYCRRMGFDAQALPWYRALECFDTWRWLLKTGQPFVHHTAGSLRATLERWLDGSRSC